MPLVGNKAGVVLDGIAKKFGDLQAVDNVSLQSNQENSFLS